MGSRKQSVRVGVLMGGQSAEREISLQTGEAVCEALTRRGYRVAPIDVDANVPWQLRSKKIDVAFLALHGPGGEDGTIQGLLEVLGIPYTGSGVGASAMAMDKSVAKSLLSAHGIPVPKGVTLERTYPARVPPSGLRWPLVVKPATQGSTIGVSIVKGEDGWRAALRKAYRYGRRVVVEQYIAGREVDIGVLDGKALPAVEVVAPDGFYDFDAKYRTSDTQYRCPAPLLRATLNRLHTLAVDAYRVLGCAGAARVDFRLNRHRRPFVLEVNTIPGMTERSLLPMAAKQAGISYDALVERMLRGALNVR